MQPQHEVAGVLNAHWSEVQSRTGIKVNTWQLRTLNAVRRCRTAELGAHVNGCSSCGHLRISYNSCRNRHCPKCQGAQREKWIQAREAELLPVPYFHLVFTLPDTLNQLCLHKDKEVYNILFMACAQYIWARPKVAGRTNRNDKHPSHLGPNDDPSPASSLHCTRWRAYQTG